MMAFIPWPIEQKQSDIIKKLLIYWIFIPNKSEVFVAWKKNVDWYKCRISPILLSCSPGWNH